MRDILQRAATVAEVADLGTLASLGATTISDADLNATMEDVTVNLVRFYFSRMSHRGGEVTWLTDRSAGKSIVPRGIDAREWFWRDVISTKWQMLKMN